MAALFAPRANVLDAEDSTAMVEISAGDLWRATRCHDQSHGRALAAFRGLLTGIRQKGRTRGYPVDAGCYRPANSPTLDGSPPSP
jgi:hypothetical protein